ncbi:MAG: desulfoferrodoxin family protein [Thermodesulfobacteriota bacterium]|nr:desulfoferrodoxin family protein [Thermodesulfobacteriota bacterium]
MSERRKFIKGSLAAAAVVAAGSASSALAMPKSCPKSCPTANPSLTGIIYSKANPGKWEKKVGGHAPQVTVADGKVTVLTNHGMSEKHFIVRHTLVLADGTVAGEKTFSPSDEKAESVFELPADYKGRIIATSFCNLHDFWVTPAQV